MRDLKSLILKKALFIIGMVLGLTELNAQSGDYTIEIRQPSNDTIFICQDQTIIFLADGQNSDGSAFDANEVTFTWDFGYGGEIKTGNTVSYAYPEGGHYLLRLTGNSVTGIPALNEVTLHVYVSLSPDFLGTRSDQSSICSGDPITLTGFVQSNPWTGDDFVFENTYDEGDFVWQGPGLESDYRGVARAVPPLDEGHMNYIFRVMDDFGCFHDTTLIIYGVYAEYTLDPISGEAPLEVTFSVDSSSNGGFESNINYIWDYYEISLDSLDPVVSESEVVEIEHPGEYLTGLTARYDQCTFRVELDQPVVVDSSLLEIPNVFTPNDDGLNDYFQVKAVSLKSLHGQVFNRWGKLVYEWDDWKALESGWNGKYMGTGSDSPSGTYFYVIKATGWDYIYEEGAYKKYEDKIYTGSVSLFR